MFDHEAHREEAPRTLRSFGALLDAMGRLDRGAADCARRELASRGWRVWHSQLPDAFAATTSRQLTGDRRPMERIWDFASLARQAVADFARRVSDGDAPTPTQYDELGPAWDRGLDDRWIGRKGLDR